MKWLVWLALGLLVYFALRKQAKHNKAKHPGAKHDAAQTEGAAGTTTQPPSSSSKPSEKMVMCSYCQVYLPASEATQLFFKSSEHYFCCEEHVRLFLNKNSPSSSTE